MVHVVMIIITPHFQYFTDLDHHVHFITGALPGFYVRKKILIFLMC